MHEGSHVMDIILVVMAFLAAAVVFVPVFKRLGLGAVLGYLFAGFLLARFHIGGEAHDIMEYAELGVVFLLFLIGLELNPTRLWAMRRDIFGLGALQVLVCGAVLMIYPLVVVGLSWQTSLVAGLGLALSSTALVMQIIEERSAMGLPYGQKTFAVLLMQDIAIVPMLIMVTLLSPTEAEMGAGAVALSIGEALLAIGVVVLVGHYALSPVFRILARFGGTEIMTAAAVLVVLASGYAMVEVGLSMAMGAFLAGVLLAESNYRHELEADIEPFRGILLGLFFVSVGMSIEPGTLAQNWLLLLGGVICLVTLKTFVVYALVRLFGGDHPTATKTGLLLSQGGEFGFVLFTTAAAAGVMSSEDATLSVSVVILSMITTPFLIRFVPPLVIKTRKRDEPDEDFEGADGEVLIVGFGRYGQQVSQMLLAGGVRPTLLDNDADRVAEARRFGSRVYYGDGTRLDVLRAAGAERCKLIAVCTDRPGTTTTVVDLVKESFPHAQCFARSYDRRHALTLFDHKVDYERREMLDSAHTFGRDALVAMGMSMDEALDVLAMVRKRDAERMDFQRIEGLVEGHRKWKEVTPEPYVRQEEEDAAAPRAAAE